MNLLNAGSHQAAQAECELSQQSHFRRGGNNKICKLHVLLFTFFFQDLNLDYSRLTSTLFSLVSKPI